MALMALLCSAAFAQKGTMWIGGEISSKSDGNDDHKVSSLAFGPQFGLFLSDKWAIGGSMIFTQDKNEDTNIESSGVALSPFVRYTFAQAGKFDFFINGGLSIGSYKTENDNFHTETEYRRTSLGINPGIVYNFNNKFAAQLHLPSLFSVYSYSGDREDNGHYFGINDNYTIDNYLMDAGFSFIFKF
jgi:outer membrane protein